MESAIQFGNGVPFTEQQNVPQPQQLPRKPANHLFFALNSDSYSAGDLIDGVLVLVVQEHQIQIKNMHIKWEGREFTNWWEGTQLNVPRTAQRTIFSRVLHLWAPNQTNNMLNLGNGLLESGTYTWSFQWELPSGIPSTFVDNFEVSSVSKSLPWVIPTGGFIPRSFAGERSNITYTGIAVLEMEPDEVDLAIHKKMQELKHFQQKYTSQVQNQPQAAATAPAGVKMLECQTFYNVFQRYDPETKKIEAAVKEVQMIALKAERYPLFSRMPTKLKVTLPHGAVAYKGYRLPIKIEVINGSTSKLDNLKLRIHESITLNAQGEVFQRKNQIFVGVIKHSGVDPQGFYAKEIQFDLPPEMEPSVTLGTLVQRHYELMVEMGLSWAHINHTFPLEVYEPSSTDDAFLSKLIPNDADMPVEEDESPAPYAPPVVPTKPIPSVSADNASVQGNGMGYNSNNPVNGMPVNDPNLSYSMNAMNGIVGMNNRSNLQDGSNFTMNSESIGNMNMTTMNNVLPNQTSRMLNSQMNLQGQMNNQIMGTSQTNQMGNNQMNLQGQMNPVMNSQMGNNQMSNNTAQMGMGGMQYGQMNPQDSTYMQQQYNMGYQGQYGMQYQMQGSNMYGTPTNTMNSSQLYQQGNQLYGMMNQPK